MKKVGKGFLQSGYGKGLNKIASIYEINGKYYAKCSKTAKVAFDGDKLNENLVCVNKFPDSLGGGFYQVSLKNHE